MLNPHGERHDPQGLWFEVWRAKGARLSWEVSFEGLGFRVSFASGFVVGCAFGCCGNTDPSVRCYVIPMFFP